MTMAPAARSRAATVASCSGTKPFKMRLPAVVSRPAVVMLSLSATGTPCSGPFVPECASAFAAAASAPSASTRRNAFTFASVASMRARHAFVTSVALTFPLESCAATSLNVASITRSPSG